MYIKNSKKKWMTYGNDDEVLKTSTKQKFEKNKTKIVNICTCDVDMMRWDEICLFEGDVWKWYDGDDDDSGICFWYLDRDVCCI